MDSFTCTHCPFDRQTLPDPLPTTGTAPHPRTPKKDGFSTSCGRYRPHEPFFLLCFCGKQEAGSRKQEAGSRKQEAGSRAISYPTVPRIPITAPEDCPVHSTVTKTAHRQENRPIPSTSCTDPRKAFHTFPFLSLRPSGGRIASLAGGRYLAVHGIFPYSGLRRYRRISGKSLPKMPALSGYIGKTNRCLPRTNRLRYLSCLSRFLSTVMPAPAAAKARLKTGSRTPGTGTDFSFPASLLTPKTEMTVNGTEIPAG